MAARGARTAAAETTDHRSLGRGTPSGWTHWVAAFVLHQAPVKGRMQIVEFYALKTLADLRA
jgi:hypothetical protein